MTRPTVAVTLHLPAEDVLAARRAGMVPNSLLNPLWRVLEGMGPLELARLEAECQEWHERKRGERC